MDDARTLTKLGRYESRLAPTGSRDAAHRLNGAARLTGLRLVARRSPHRWATAFQVDASWRGC